MLDKMFTFVSDKCFIHIIYFTMIGIISTLSSIECQPVYSLVELSPSTDYVIQTENIVKMRVYSTDDSILRYTWNRHDDQRHSEEIIVSQTNAEVAALADVEADSNVILLPVFEGAVNFAETASMTAVNTYFNVSDISWISENSDGTLAKMFVVEGGFKEKQYIINYNLDQIMDICTSGSTTTTTTTH